MNEIMKQYLGAVIFSVGYIMAYALYRYNLLETAIPAILVLVGVGVILSFMRRSLGSIESSMPPKKKKKTKPNDKCPCGSGEKYKKCCKIREDQEESFAPRIVIRGHNGSSKIVSYTNRQR